MDFDEKTRERRKRVHTVLAQSYAFFLVAFLGGLFLDFVFPVGGLEKSNENFLGLLIIIFGSILIFSAQKASRDFKKNKTVNLTKENFLKGPYKFTRTPTHWGLFFLTLGFGLMVNAFFVIIFTILSFFVTKLVFLKKEEEILVEKYGEPYVEYKKIVRF